MYDSMTYLGIKGLMKWMYVKDNFFLYIIESDDTQNIQICLIYFCKGYLILLS